VQHARSVNNRMPGYVASRVAEALNGVGKALHGAKVVVLGLAYKPGVDDVRESPALNVLDRLLRAGADCVYHDPHVRSVSVCGNRARMESVPLDDELIAGADCVVVLTAHPGIDYASVVAHAPLVFDATGVTRPWRSPHVVLL
jgi:UDP-N-acetyl-D-glucosamine dehydrogenase